MGGADLWSGAPTVRAERPLALNTSCPQGSLQSCLVLLILRILAARQGFRMWSRRFRLLAGPKVPCSQPRLAACRYVLLTLRILVARQGFRMWSRRFRLLAGPQGPVCSGLRLRCYAGQPFRAAAGLLPGVRSGPKFADDRWNSARLPFLARLRALNTREKPGARRFSGCVAVPGHAGRKPGGTPEKPGARRFSGRVAVPDHAGRKPGGRAEALPHKATRFSFRFVDRRSIETGQKPWPHKAAAR
jgi:hypothetical protein